jgi:hypothetical protein
MLGIPANKRDRALRERAVKEFSERNPEFLVSGNTLDYDGYVQYVCNGQMYSVFIEGEKEIWKFRDHKLDELGHGSAHLETIDNQLIPEIKNLFLEHKNFWKRRANEQRTAVNIVLSQLWLNDQLKNQETNRFKSEVYDKFSDMISNNEIPFYSVEEISKSVPYTELLVMSKFLESENIKIPLNNPDIKLSKVDEYSFRDLRGEDRRSSQSIYSEIHEWCKYYFKLHRNIDIECESQLRVCDWG